MHGCLVELTLLLLRKVLILYHQQTDQCLARFPRARKAGMGTTYFFYLAQLVLLLVSLHGRSMCCSR